MAEIRVTGINKLFGTVQALGLLEHPRAVFDRATLGFAGGVVEPGDSGVGDARQASTTKRKRARQTTA
jgi:hypothetical protein